MFYDTCELCVIFGHRGHCSFLFLFLLGPCDVRCNWFDILFNFIVPTSCVFFYAITYNIRELLTSMLEEED